MENSSSDTVSVLDTVRKPWQNWLNAAPSSFPILSVAKKSPSLDTLIKLANALDISVDILLGKELKHYTFEKLKYIEEQMKNLPASDQQKILDIVDSVVAIELNYHNEKRHQKEC